MPSRYAALPTDDDTRDEELEQAFDVSDDEGEERQQTQPLLAREERQTASDSPSTPHHSNGLYNFDYDHPPAGAPPGQYAEEGNTWGNNNGVLPDASNVVYGKQDGWLRRAWGKVTGQQSTAEGRVVGGGTQNDGVFANISSRPTAAPPRTAQVTEANESVHVAPEFAQSDAPPTYVQAQSDAPPAYWENTVLATQSDDFLIENLPTGNILAFLWSFLLSYSLQWVGFAMAYMLSTSHAGRYGARAGFGITLVQFGLYFRAAGESDGWSRVGDEDSSLDGTPGMQGNWTWSGYPGMNFTLPSEEAQEVTAEMYAIRDWVAMFTMTAGWFLFLTALLGFWRVKRWENSIRATQATPQPVTNEDRTQALVNRIANQNPHLESGLSLGFILSQGLGLRRARDSTDSMERVESGLPPSSTRDGTEDENAQRRQAETFDRRLRTDLRSFI